MVSKQHPLRPLDECSEEAQPESAGEAEQQPIQEDDEGVPRRRDRTLLVVDKEVPTLEDQAGILRIHVKSWTRATASRDSYVQRRWSATFVSKKGARGISLS